MRTQALDKLNVKVLKILREANSTSNLAVIGANTFESATNVSEIDINAMIFTMPTAENIETLHKMMALLSRECHIAEYASLRNQLFYEYFENRMYLLEQYLHAITRIFESDGVTASEFLGVFLAKFLRLISDEQNYFVAQFGSPEDFSSKWVVFRRENEYDMI